MVSIRSESPGDPAAVRAVHRAAFQTDDEADLVDALRDSSGFDPDLSLVAERDGDVVGHILLSPVSLLDDPSAAALVLGPVGVLPPEQGRGVGSALIRTALERSRGADRDYVFLHGSPAFYSRFGFRPAEQFGFVNPFDTPPAEFQVRRLSERPPAGGRLDYPPAFRML